MVKYGFRWQCGFTSATERRDTSLNIREVAMNKNLLSSPPRIDKDVTLPPFTPAQNFI